MYLVFRFSLLNDKDEDQEDQRHDAHQPFHVLSIQKRIGDFVGECDRYAHKDQRAGEHGGDLGEIGGQIENSDAGAEDFRCKQHGKEPYHHSHCRDAVSSAIVVGNPRLQGIGQHHEQADEACPGDQECREGENQSNLFGPIKHCGFSLIHHHSRMHWCTRFRGHWTARGWGSRSS